MGSRWRMRAPLEAPALIRILGPIGVVANNAMNVVQYHGIAHVPANGPVIFVSNHTVHLDFLSAGVAMFQAGRSPCFAAGSDFFGIPVLGAALRGAGAVQVLKDRPNAADSLDGMRQALDAGRALLVFPEGTFTRDPQLWPMRGKTGVVRLAASRPDVPIIPVAHWGNESVLNPWTKKLNLAALRCRLDVAFGEPIDLSEYLAKELTYEVLTEATAQVMSAIEDILVPLRQANPAGYSTRPRDTRWDVKVHGDPNALSDAQNRAKRREYVDKRAARKSRLRNIFRHK